MKAFKPYLVTLCCCLLSVSVSYAFTTEHSAMQQDTILPKVFLIGEYESQYETALVEHETLLFTACDYKMDIAYDKWTSMLREMEAYADAIDFDLKGTKLWLNVMWEKDGSVNHIAYYLKTVSRNIDTAELSAFFSSFMNNYTFPLQMDKKYSHFGSASFPIFPQRVEVQKKKVAIEGSGGY